MNVAHESRGGPEAEVLSRFVWKILARALSVRSRWRDEIALRATFGGDPAMGDVVV